METEDQVIGTEPELEVPNEAPQEAGEGVQEPQPVKDLPTALAELEEANRRVREVNRESAGRRKEIADLKKRIEDLTKGTDSTSSELAELRAQLEAANAKLKKYSLRDRYDAVVAKGKISFVSPAASRDAFEFALDALAKLPEDAEDEDILDIVKDVVKARPYLLNKPTPPNINAVNAGTSDALEGLDLEKIKRDFGITNR